MLGGESKPDQNNARRNRQNDDQNLAPILADRNSCEEGGLHRHHDGV